ncbi:hypothetical protein KDX30_15620 [Pseudomonas sp. CDFA 553]|uniref:hypothetical protein n=1 Tax=Pseudomonas quasicaspiana TaxID=2829821 RepID=UPI001E4F839F|nr:hypothetical protein [Pseudomonas quasicaspiana]MCD5989326.1 hypothetical protein [Pseudomonas quasicaspiana]
MLSPDDTFFGLAVAQIAIPYPGPVSVHAIYLEDSPSTVEAALIAKFKNIKLNNNDGISPV